MKFTPAKKKTKKGEEDKCTRYLLPPIFFSKLAQSPSNIFFVQVRSPPDILGAEITKADTFVFSRIYSRVFSLGDFVSSPSPSAVLNLLYCVRGFPNVSAAKKMNDKKMGIRYREGGTRFYIKSVLCVF